MRGQHEAHPGPDSAVERQLRELRTFVDSMGWSNQGEYSDEGISGLTRNRPALDRLLQACRAGQANVVVMTHTARLFRSISLSLALFEELTAMNVRIVLPDGPLVPAFRELVINRLNQLKNE